MTPELAWLILIVPFLSFLVIAFVTRPYKRLSGYVTILGVGIAMVLSYLVLKTVVDGEHEVLRSSFTWFQIGNIELRFGLQLDPLTAIMLVVVTSVSFLVQIFSQGYMVVEHPSDPHRLIPDPGYSRYYAWMALFTTSMLGLVLADNLVMLYMSWELVGLCSYLLIGYYFEKPEAASAAKKAFLVTRLGDLGFLIGILVLFFIAGTTDFVHLEELARLGALGELGLTIAALGIFAGAVGKSAQFPLHMWLPDAMEGPTPVSALIHAATMVAAGVYLVARTFPLFEHAPVALETVAIIGGFTAIFAATMGLVMHDIKKVMAYSTISQLGYMMLGLGVGSMAAGMFHLFTHAFFKALLFLGSGSVIFGCHHNQDMRYMGGLRKYMPITFTTILIASLALSGIPPFSGFFSKDEILVKAFDSGHYVLFGMALAGAFMTAFYVFRMIFMTFFGEYRGHLAPSHGAHGGGHGHGEHKLPKESPLVMTGPLMILAVAAALTGFLSLDGAFFSFLEGHEEEIHYNYALMGSSIAVAAAGIFFAWLVYHKKAISTDAVVRAIEPLYVTVYNKWWVDHILAAIVNSIILSISSVMAAFDRKVIDAVVNGAASAVRGSGASLRRVQTGQVQSYGLAIAVGIVVIAASFLFFGH
ncbi:MAG: NADH-quinone oxidoreductase subunit L [Chloroflexota bacterium]|nr:MAG: NADH-quinone oxidoreductase subunit L [Chloroflexota bacterium]